VSKLHKIGIKQSVNYTQVCDLCMVLTNRTHDNQEK